MWARSPLSSLARPINTASAHWEARLQTHPQPDTTRVIWLTIWGRALVAHNVRSARPVLLAALALTNTGDTRRFSPSLKIQLGTTYANVGAFADARNYRFDALRVARYHQYPNRENPALSALGEICRQQRHGGAARAYFVQSLAVSQHLGHAPAMLAAQLNLA